MQLKKVVYSLSFSALKRSHCRDDKMAKNVMGARKKELGAWRENGREDRERKCSYNAVKSASRTMSTRVSSSA